MSREPFDMRRLEREFERDEARTYQENVVEPRKQECRQDVRLAKKNTK